jgi:hypothetical protein
LFPEKPAAEAEAEPDEEIPENPVIEETSEIVSFESQLY